MWIWAIPSTLTVVAGVEIFDSSYEVISSALPIPEQIVLLQGLRRPIPQLESS